MKRKKNITNAIEYKHNDTFYETLKHMYDVNERTKGENGEKIKQ